MKKLRLYNGGQIYSGNYNRCHFYIAAYSFNHCVELLNKATGANTTAGQLNPFYNKGAWGNAMQNIEALEPCVYYTEPNNDKLPKRIL